MQSIGVLLRIDGGRKAAYATLPARGRVKSRIAAPH
jgi:hypothetical protein